MCYDDWKLWDRKLWLPNLIIIWIKPDDKEWCQDLIWGDMWIGTDDKWCSHDEI
jgi:hypothetical protein